MAKRISIADTSIAGPPLPDECFQYLQTFDQIEKFSNAPNLLDQNLWQILCRMRRNKIEVELKVNTAQQQAMTLKCASNFFSIYIFTVAQLWRTIGGSRSNHQHILQRDQLSKAKTHAMRQKIG